MKNRKLLYITGGMVSLVFCACVGCLIVIGIGASSPELEATRTTKAIEGTASVTQAVIAPSMTNIPEATSTPKPINKPTTTATLEPMNTPTPTDIPQPTNSLEPTKASTPTPTSTATPDPFADLDIFIGASDSDSPDWEVSKLEEGISCVSFRFSLSGGGQVRQALEEADAQVYLEILKDGEFFEGFGPYSFKDIDRYFEIYWFADYLHYEECVQTKLPDTSDYVGMEFRLALLHNDAVIAEFSGIRNNYSGWETSELSPTVVERCVRIKVKQIGREEPQYVGIQGYLKAELDSRYYDDALPSHPWGVPILEQTGPELWEESGETLPAKTPVVVLEQHLKHEGYGRYSGSLVVKSLEDEKEYRINVHHFTPTDYWNCPPYLAINYSPFIARVKEDVQPLDRDGRWAEMGEQKEVLCVRHADSNTNELVTNGVNCLVYKQYTNGFGGVEHTFPSDSLEIIY